MITKPAFIREWLFNPRLEILSGLVVALALIPEAIVFRLSRASIRKLACMRPL
jgi:MFS superfamily sulfate permease-like transporter